MPSAWGPPLAGRAGSGLINRRSFTAQLEQRLARASAAECLAVLFIDLDDFTSVNDTARHAVGDALLVEVARRLEAAVRTTDLVARFGVDEFVAVVSGASDEELCAAAERLRSALAGPYVLAGREVVTHASVGVALAPAGATADDVLRNADLAMYHAEGGGRDRTSCYVPDMHDEAVRRVELAAELRTAIDEGVLTLHYQPIVDLCDGAVGLLQALLRWQRRDGTYVPPAEFIPVAEETGLTVSLGRWVLRQAMRQLAEWRAAGLDVGVAVNLSTRQLESADLVSDVATALSWTGVPPSSLMLEITENVLVDNPARSDERLRQLLTSASWLLWTTSAPASRRWPISASSRSTCSRSTGPSSPGSRS
jgi:diguanylate cyclase (GGDEF)-like protein